MSLPTGVEDYCQKSPSNAVQIALVHTLLDFGATINGLEDDGSPLITALAFGYRKAAEVLASRGARVDTVVANLELALVWADLHERTDGVEFLAQKGVNPRARDQWNRPVA